MGAKASLALANFTSTLGGFLVANFRTENAAAGVALHSGDASCVSSFSYSLQCYFYTIGLYLIRCD